MVVDTPQSNMADQLRRILSSTRGFQRFLESRIGQPKSTQVPLNSLPSFDLPAIPDISSRLKDHGVPEHVVPSILHIYVSHANKLRQCARDCMARSWTETYAMTSVSAPSSMKLTLDMQTRVYQTQLEQFTARMLAELQTRFRQMPVMTSSRRGHRPVFNQDFVPVLEQCFKHDAYPTQADRAFFARKSMMTPRQIEVWFQNHRRRARKEGKPVVRRRPDDRSPVDFESLAKSMPDLFIPQSQRSDIVDSDWDDDDEDSEEVENLPSLEYAPAWNARHVRQAGALDVLDVKGPPHAFPTVFSECRNHHPFPTTDEGFSFSPPAWMRKPATQRVNCLLPDFEDLTARFERLNFLSPDMTSSTKKSRCTGPSSAIQKPSLETCFTATILLSDGRPAFATTGSERCVVPLAALPRIPIVRAPEPRLHAFQTPAPESPPVSLLPPSVPSSSIPVYKNIPPRRQIARLPRRAPQSHSIAHRDSPTSPSLSSPSSSSSGSRTSSLESLFSSHTRASSNGSDTSLPNMPITPTFPPAPLQAPAPVTATDFSFTDDLFGDSLFDLSFPPDAFQLNGFGNAAKQIQTPSYNDFNFNFTPSQFLQA